MVAALYQILTVNLAATVKRVSHGGRSYLVAPASLIVPGVLNGSDGALYYPPDETERNPGIWNGMPIVVYHPTYNGLPIAAQDPQYKDHVAESTIGFLRNDRFLGKRVAEAWFDEEKTRNYDTSLPQHVRILPRLNANQPIELSTGLHVDRDDTPGVCPKTGRNYDAVARNHKPDHLAVLPDQRGACSIQDGCGVVMNNTLVNNTDDSEGRWVSLPNGVHVQIKDGEIVKGPDIHPADKAMEKAKKEGAERKVAHEEKMKDLRSRTAAAKKLADEATASRKATEAKIKSYAEQDKTTKNAGRYGNPHDLATGKLLPHGSGTGKGDVHAAAVEGHKCKCGGLCKECKKMTTENSNPEGCNQYKSCAEAAEKASDKAFKSGDKTDHEVAAGAHSKAWELAVKGRDGPSEHHKRLAKLHGQKSNPTTNGDTTMATATKLSAGEREGLVNKITANCDCQEPDREKARGIVNQFSDATLMKLNAMAEDSADDSSVVAEEDETTPKGKFGKKKVPPQFAKNEENKVLTAKEWLDSAPPEIRSWVTNAGKIERRERATLIEKLVANTAKEQRVKYETFLSNKSLDELETLVEMMPVQTQNQDDVSRLFGPVFTGSAGGYEGQRPVKQEMTFNAEADPEMDPQYALRQLAKK